MLLWMFFFSFFFRFVLQYWLNWLTGGIDGWIVDTDAVLFVVVGIFGFDRLCGFTFVHSRISWVEFLLVFGSFSFPSHSILNSVFRSFCSYSFFSLKHSISIILFASDDISSNWNFTELLIWNDGWRQKKIYTNILYTHLRIRCRKMKNEPKKQLKRNSLLTNHENVFVSSNNSHLLLEHSINKRREKPQHTHTYGLNDSSEREETKVRTSISQIPKFFFFLSVGTETLELFQVQKFKSFSIFCFSKSV